MKQQNDVEGIQTTTFKVETGAFQVAICHKYTHRERHTHTLSALQCFFITNQPQEIINEGLGGYTAAKPRRMSE